MDTFERPTITVPEGEAPTDLVIEDQVTGDGAEAGDGAQVNVDYVGVSWSSGQEFDASWNRGDTLGFTIGAGQVIQGWDLGVACMLIGETRELKIPPELGYGPHGKPPVPPNATLLFEIELVDLVDPNASE